MPVLMIFVDGVGIGKEDPKTNPFCRGASCVFNLYDGSSDGTAVRHTFLENGWIKAVDCRMNMPGTPQSATGQTALFTGINTAKYIGCHLAGFPNKKLKDLLRSESIMVRLERMGLRVLFANAFTPPYFTGKINRVSATTAMAEACTIRIRSFDDLEKGGAVFMDLTNNWLIEKGYWVTRRTVEKAGEVLASIAKNNDFTLFEYFISDVIGHRGDMQKAVEQVAVLDKFVSSAWDSMDHQDELFIIVSDHGNLEDTTVKTHTENKIPLIAAGRSAQAFIGRVNCITDIAQAIVYFFQNGMIIASEKGD